MVFVHEQLFDGKEIWVLKVDDIFTKFTTALDVRFAYEGVDIVEVFEHIARESGYQR